MSGSIVNCTNLDSVRIEAEHPMNQGSLFSPTDSGDFVYREPPAQAHSATSQAAAEAIAPKAGTMRERVLAAITAAGDDGLSDEQGCDITDMSGSTYRPRRIELAAAGLIRHAGKQRKTRAGVEAEVWVATGDVRAMVHEQFG